MRSFHAAALALVCVLGTHAPAAEILVTDERDSTGALIEGSLRWAIENAEPGDTIRFQEGLIPGIQDQIVIPPDLVGLTIVGPTRMVGVRRNPRLIVRASGVTLSNLTLQGVRIGTVVGDLISQGDEIDKPLFDDLVIEDCTLTGGGIDLSNVRRGSVRRCTLSEPKGRNPVGIRIQDSRECTIADNVVQDGLGITELEGLDVSITGNQVSGGVLRVHSRSGTVRGNTLTDGAFFFVQAPTLVQGRGRLVIDDNDIPSARIVRTNVDITGNRIGVGLSERLRKRGDIRLSVYAFDTKLGTSDVPQARDETVLVEDNLVEYGVVSMLVRDDPRRGAPLRVIGNRVRFGSFRNLRVAGAEDLELRGNLIEDAAAGPAKKRKKKGGSSVPGIDVQGWSGTSVVSENVVEGVTGDGIVLSGEGTLTFEDNEIRDVGGDGVKLKKGSTLAASGGSITGCAGYGVKAKRGWRIEWTGGAISGNGRGGIDGGRAGAVILNGVELRENAGDGAAVGKRGTLEATDCMVADNEGAGLAYDKRTSGTVTGGSVTGNGRGGVVIGRRGSVHVTGTTMGENNGAGIDVFPFGKTPNTRKKKANGGIDFPVLEVDVEDFVLRGTAPKNQRIELFRAFGDEGVELLGTVTVGQDGTFVFPQSGRFDCPPGTPVTATATFPLGEADETSEFADPVVWEVPVPPIRIASVSSDEENADGLSLVRSAGSSATSSTPNRCVSDDGRFVVFTSAATNLVGDDTNGDDDVFLRDLVEGTTTRVSLLADGSQLAGAPGSTFGAGSLGVISGDGRFAFFQTSSSSTSDLDHGGLLRRDLETGALLNVGTLMRDGSTVGDVSDYAVSADGGVLAFVTRSSFYDTEDGNLASDVYLWTGVDQVAIVSLTDDDEIVRRTDAGTCSSPKLSADGNLVAFLSSHDGLTTGDDGASRQEAYLRDVAAGTTEMISITSTGARATCDTFDISTDGRFVVFSSGDDGVTPDDSNGRTDVFLLDRTDGSVERISVRTDGSDFDGFSCRRGTVSADGDLVAFQVTAGQFRSEIWLRQRSTGLTVYASQGATSVIDTSHDPRLTPDGRVLVFSSARDDLVDGDANLLEDVFVLDVPALLE